MHKRIQFLSMRMDRNLRMEKGVEMRKVFIDSLAVALFAGLATSTSLAQVAPPPAAPQATAPAAAPVRPAGPPQQIDLATAKKMAAAAEAAATALNQHIAICIMDARGDMVFFERGDTINAIPVGSSQGKAHAVLMFGLPTKDAAAAIKAGTPVTAMLKAPMAGFSDLDIRQGGLPIMKNGKMIGAIGVGGSASESDEAFAQAGIDALSK
jgi:glc operon protein GlcG